MDRTKALSDAARPHAGGAAGAGSAELAF